MKDPWIGSAPRRGNVSLIEVVVLMFVTTVALGLVGSTLASLARVDAKYDRLAAGSGDIDRLLRRLRDDLHAASSVNFDGATLTLGSLDNQRVVYRLATPRSSRERADEVTGYKTSGVSRWVVSMTNRRLVRVVALDDTGPSGSAPRPLATLVAEIARHAPVREVGAP